VKNPDHKLPSSNSLSQCRLRDKLHCVELLSTPFLEYSQLNRLLPKAIRRINGWRGTCELFIDVFGEYLSIGLAYMLSSFQPQIANRDYKALGQLFYLSVLIPYLSTGQEGRAPW
jgi:hypothetical protein